MVKVILKSLLKKKLSVFYIVIQVSLTVYLLFSILTTLNVLSFQESQINSIVGNKKNHLINIIYQDLYPSKNFAENVYNLNKYANSLPEVQYAGGFVNTSYVFDELKNNTKYIEKFGALYKGTLRGQHLEMSDVVLLDKGLESLMNIKVIDGKELRAEDFYLNDGSTIPVVAGNNYTNILRIGDELHASNSFSSETNKKFIVIGFLKKDSKWLSSGDYISNKPITLDDKIIIPLFSGTENNILAATSKATSYFVVLKDKNYVESAKFKLINQAKELGLNIDCYTIDESIEKYKNENNEILKDSLIIICFLSVMSSFSIIVTMLSTIEKRKKELGIRMMAGASVSYLKRLVLYETAIITILSSIIATLYITYEKYNYYTSFLQTSFDIASVFQIKTTLAIIIWIVLFSTLVTFIPLRKIQKLQPKELIGGLD